MKEKVILYINARIHRSSGIGGDTNAISEEEVSRKSHAELTRDNAKDGIIAATAGHLGFDDTLPPSEKAEILAEAFENYSIMIQDLTNSFNAPLNHEYYIKEAKRSAKIALGLRRAAKKSQDP
jgi:hypothetical protein